MESLRKAGCEYMSARRGTPKNRGGCGRVGSVHLAERPRRWHSKRVVDASPLSGEFLTVPDLVELFDISPGKVHRLIEERHLAAVRIDGVLRVPAEFVRDAEPLPALRGTLIVLADAGFSEEEQVEWLLSENEELRARPIDVLLSGSKSAVRRAAQSLF